MEEQIVLKEEEYAQLELKDENPLGPQKCS